MTTSNFTKAAKEAAERLNIKLINGLALHDKLSSWRKSLLATESKPTNQQESAAHEPVTTTYWNVQLMIYLLAGLMLALVWILRSPKFKGMIGESSVRHKLSKLDPKQYKVLHDLIIQRADGKTSQIDHVVISRYGVFVIETKNYTGWIVGSQKSGVLDAGNL